MPDQLTMDRPSKKDSTLICTALDQYATSLEKEAKRLEDLGETKMADDLKLKGRYVIENVKSQFAEQASLDLGVTDRAAGEPPIPGTAVVLHGRPPRRLPGPKKGK